MGEVIDRNTAEHYLWDNNCDSWVFADTVGLSVKQGRMPRGTREKLHFHTNAQQFFRTQRVSDFLFRGKQDNCSRTKSNISSTRKTLYSK